MGPTIILDKSAYQSLSDRDIAELDRYFFAVVPPVLILEILADLKKPNLETAAARKVVQRLAQKIHSVGMVNLAYRGLCVSNLLGGPVPMDRKAVVGGARRVRAADGSVGHIVDVQPEKNALLRWSMGKFDEAEEFIASEWRRATEALDLPTFQRQFQPEHAGTGEPSLKLVCEAADQVLSLPEAQPRFIAALLHDIGTISEVREWTWARWERFGASSLRDFAPYAHYCARVSFVFHQALIHRLIGTRNSNRIDMEYLYYAPFAHIFCSGDKLHAHLAEALLERDQSFVPREELCHALREVADARMRAQPAGNACAAAIQPEPESLIRTLWIRHIGHWPTPAPGTSKSLSDGEREQLMKKLKPIVDAIKRSDDQRTSRPRWPRSQIRGIDH